MRAALAALPPALLALLLPARAAARPLVMPSLELAALTPAIVAALFLVTLVIFLAGCVCCKRNKFKQFSNAATNDLPEMVGTTSPPLAQASVSPVDTGIINPIAEREFTIFVPLSPENLSRPRGNSEISADHPRIPHLEFFGPPDIENNNPPFENNNGPISPQELENIVNNNAENYIVSEYENRNLNNVPSNENAFVEEPQFFSSFLQSYQEPTRHIEDFMSSGRLDDYRDWFENPDDNFPRNQLQYLQEIGRGWFGRIVEAEAHNLRMRVGCNESQSPKITKVAVKILDENVSATKKNNFLDECKLYRDANNMNVLQLLGYNLCQDPWLIFFEYCPMGDLKTFLISNKSTMASQGRREIPLKFQCEIASAISYLHSQNVIHPDIACHSCMVSEGLIAKLGDYGGAKYQHPSDFYNLFERSIPLRWLAPETWMQTNTKESNVWSLGIFLWESCNWGTLPYDSLNDEQVISSVLCQNGMKLPEPYSNNDYGTYLYQIMISCWSENPMDRTTAAQALSLLQYIYSNHVANINTEKDESVMQNFDSRWLNFKPNTIPKIDNNYPTYSQLASDKDSNYHSSELDETLSKFDRDSLCPAESEGSTDVLDEFSERTKSDSLTNLHGSLESIQEKSVLENDSCIVKNVDKNRVDSSANNTENKSPFNCANAGLDVAPWLQDLPVTSQEDMSYIKTVSDVISDLDNMLSSEKTSSSESSHQTSPSRDISNSAILSSKHISADTLYSGRTDIKEHSGDINKNVEHCSRLNASGSMCVVSDSLSDTSIENANIDSRNISTASQRVPELNEIKDSNEQDLYPTLDFRLERLEDKENDKNVYQIFQNKFITNSQDYDSLQDTSYIPYDAKNETSDNSNDKGDFCRQCSSGSETDDEIWKRRIEMGTITEKIKLKSKSVTDFMVLTHIDMDFTDLESEDASFTSVDGKSISTTQKKSKLDYPKDSSLPVDEYLSFPRNCSFSINGRSDSINKPDFDVVKYKKNLRNITLRNLRPARSHSDITSLQNKTVSIKDLLDYKKVLDSFLDGKLNCNIATNVLQNENDDNVTELQGCESLLSPCSENDTTNSWETTKYLKVNNDLILTVPQDLPENIAKKEEINVNMYESPSFNNAESSDTVPSKLEENATPLDIIRIDLNTNTSTPNVRRQSEFSCDNISPMESENPVKLNQDDELSSDLLSPSDNKLSFELENNESVAIEPNNSESKVLLGPFSDCTLDLYTGLKTTSKENENIPCEEEALMFSTNFNDDGMDNVKAKTSDFILEEGKNDISSAYFFNSPAIAMKSMSDEEKPINYSLETWDRFLGSSFENVSTQNFDSIFPDVNDTPDLSSSSDVNLKNNVEDNSNAIDQIEKIDSIEGQSLTSPTYDVIPNAEFDPHLHYYQNDFNNITSKLAIAENENNLNIEQSNTQNMETENMIDHILNNIQHINLNEDVMDHSNALENRLDSINASNDSYYIQNTLPIQAVEDTGEGWFLHPKNKLQSNDSAKKLDIEESVPYIYNENVIDSPNDNSNSEHSIDPESVEALRTELELKLPLAQLMGQCPPQMSKEILPYIDRTEAVLPNEKLNISVDLESVKALRTELELKLPLVQQFIHDNGSNDGIIESMSTNIPGFNESMTQCDDDDDLEVSEYENLSVEVTVNPINEINCKTKAEDSPTKNMSDAHIVRNEVLIHYNAYGVSLLSPIQEESWSEVSEIAKMRDCEKSDTSNSLSIGHLDSANIPAELPFDNVPDTDSKVKAAHSDDKLKDYSDDDTNDDSHLTFVVLDGFESSKLDRRASLSIDSLNGIDEQIDMDGDQDVNMAKSDVTVPEFPLPNLPAPELLSPFYEDPSHTKSTEEISQNVDNLLENISKTLENASKVGSVGSDCNLSTNLECEEMSHDESLGETDSGSKTYIIENKKVPPNDVTYVCPDKVFDVPDDVSNVSKISQPSLISDLDTTNITESQLKPSEKSMSQNLHTKTPSMDSWCSNDTLFNVEENFDDVCSFTDFLESPDKVDDDDARSITPTNIESNIVRQPIPCNQSVLHETINKQASIEMVMHCPGETEYIDDISPVLNDTDSEIIVPNLKEVDNVTPSPTNLGIEKKIDTPKMNEVVPNNESNSSGSNTSIGVLNPIEIVIDDTNDDNQIACDVILDCSESKGKETLQLLSGESSMASPMSTLAIGATSTPNDVSQVTDKKHSDMSVDSLDSADVLIDAQFEFLNNIVAPMSSLDEETSCYNFDNESPNTEVEDNNVLNTKCTYNTDPAVINFVSIDDSIVNNPNMRNVIYDFIENEKNSTVSDLSILNKKLNSDSCIDDASIDINQLKDNNYSVNAKSDSSDTNEKDDNYESISHLPEELSYSEFKQSAEKRFQESNPGSICGADFSNSDNNKSGSYINYDRDNSALLEYMGHSGLNMDSVNSKIENYPLPKTPDNNRRSSYDNFIENLKEYQENSGENDSINISKFFAYGLSNIQFSGPVSDSSNENSYIRDIKNMDDLNTIPPECLNDWDSGSDESNANSSSSGEFTWKKGDMEEPISLSASVYVPPQNTKSKHSLSSRRDYDVIAEESNSGSDSSGSSDEEIEFTPSSWNYLAAPSKSALKCANTSQNENKKRVAFKKQKYPCVYEYPREVSDHEGESPQLIGASSYMDWQSHCTNDEFEPQYEKYNNMSSSADKYYLSTDADDDFFITSSTTPFEPYNLLNSSSQFFPGQHLSLNEMDDDEPLPPVPTELLLVKPEDDLNNLNNIITSILTNSKPSDYITPDSGTEDVTPGSMIEYEFKDAKETSSDDQNNDTPNVIATNPVSRQELKLNLVNKTKSLPSCGILILPEKSSPSGSLTPSTPSPSASINSNHSSGSTSPLHPSSILGGLRHTRDKLKLDLPPSPLARNSPNILLSGKSLNSETKVFDFKHFEPHVGDISKSDQLIDAKINCVEDTSDKADDKTDINMLAATSVDNHTEKIVDSVEISSQNCSPSNDSANSDLTTLQKAVIPINMDESHKKSILEAVKGEGTLLDSGDEDSGIGSSAYTTLERKIESVKLDNELVTEINER